MVREEKYLRKYYTEEVLLNGTSELEMCFVGKLEIWMMGRRKGGVLGGFVCSNWLLWLSPSQAIESEQTQYSGVDG